MRRKALAKTIIPYISIQRMIYLHIVHVVCLIAIDINIGIVRTCRICGSMGLGKSRPVRRCDDHLELLYLSFEHHSYIQHTSSSTHPSHIRHHGRRNQSPQCPHPFESYHRLPLLNTYVSRLSRGLHDPGFSLSISRAIISQYAPCMELRGGRNMTTCDGASFVRRAAGYGSMDARERDD